MKTNLRVFEVIILLGLITVLFSECKKDDEKAKRIKVVNILTPSIAANGSTIQWDINIINLGDAIDITTIHAKFVCTSGWAKGQVLQDLDLPVSNISIEAQDTVTVFSSPVYLINTGATNVDINIKVTAYFEGGSESGVATYTILKGKKKSRENMICVEMDNPKVAAL